MCEPYEYTFEVLVDHFDGQADDAPKYEMHYIVDDQYYNRNEGDHGQKPKPIFFYSGNEGGIWDFYKNSGFMTTTLAE